MNKKIEWSKTTKFKGPEESPGFLLWKVSSQWRREVESALKTIDLTHPQFVLLASIGWLTRGDELITQVELAFHCDSDLSMTSQIVRSLEKRGYIKRSAIQSDLRAKSLTLTAQGVKKVELAIPLVEEIDRLFFQKLSTKLGPFTKLLQQLIYQE